MRHLLLLLPRYVAPADGVVRGLPPPAAGDGDGLPSGGAVVEPAVPELPLAHGQDVRMQPHLLPALPARLVLGVRQGGFAVVRSSSPPSHALPSKDITNAVDAHYAPWNFWRGCPGGQFAATGISGHGPDRALLMLFRANSALLWAVTSAFLFLFGLCFGMIDTLLFALLVIPAYVGTSLALMSFCGYSEGELWVAGPRAGATRAC